MEGSAPVSGFGASARVRPVVRNNAWGDQASADIILQRSGELCMEGAPLAEGDQLIGHVPRKHLHIEMPQCSPRRTVVLFGADKAWFVPSRIQSQPEGIAIIALD